jgi:HK97 family phage prohead protease
MLRYKSIPFEVKEISAGADGGWEIAGLASTWWGEPDAYNDVVAPGAFAASIAERATKFLYEHHTPIGKQLEIRETDDGLYGRWSIVDTAAGTDAHKLAKAGVLDSLSIGYVPLEWDIRADGVRVLQKVTLYEVSAVAIPANANAVITDVKAARVSAELPVARTAPRIDIDDELRRRRLARHGIALPAPTEAAS